MIWFTLAIWILGGLQSIAYVEDVTFKGLRCSNPSKVLIMLIWPIVIMQSIANDLGGIVLRWMQKP